MYRITFWSRSSTNFGKNSFVRRHGTESFSIQVEANALACMMSAVRNPDIQGATMEGPTGTLSWMKKPLPVVDHAGECDYGRDVSHQDIYTNTCPKCGYKYEDCDCERTKR